MTVGFLQGSPLMSPESGTRWTTWGTVSSGFREIEIGWDRLGSVGLLAPFLAPAESTSSGDRGKGTACGAVEQLGSSQFDYAQEEQKDPRDNGRDEQRAATAEPVGEEDEHDNRMECARTTLASPARRPYERNTAPPAYRAGLGVVPILDVGLT